MLNMIYSGNWFLLYQEKPEEYCHLQHHLCLALFNGHESRLHIWHEVDTAIHEAIRMARYKLGSDVLQENGVHLDLQLLSINGAPLGP